MANKAQRPVRLNTFQVRIIASDEFNHEIAKANLVGEFETKSDVHYCAEKEAIDIVNSRIEAGIGGEFTYLIYKVTKERHENDEPKDFTLVSIVYADEETGQVVID